ncbi:MAG: CHASE2 domain-containing protein, partial [Pseudomonadota bacterium]
MMQQKLRRQDWIAGLVASLLILGLSQFSFFEKWESGLVSLGMTLVERSPSYDIAVIALDDESIDEFGGWPLSQQKLLDFVAMLERAEAKAVGLALPLDTLRLQSSPVSLPTETSSITDDVSRYIKNSGLAALAECNGSDCEDLSSFKQEWNDFNEGLQKHLRTTTPAQASSRTPLRTKRRSLFSEKIVAGLSYNVPSIVPAAPTSLMPESLTQSIPYKFIESPLPSVERFVRLSDALDHKIKSVAPMSADIPGSLKTSLIVGYQDAWFPTLPLVLASKWKNRSIQDIELIDEGVLLGRTILIPTDDVLHMTPFQYQNMNVFSARELDLSASNARFEGKLVLLGLNATTHTVPGQLLATTPNVIDLAKQVTTILQGDVIATPAWAFWVKAGLILLAIAYVVLVLPTLRFRASVAWALTFSLMVILLIASVLLIEGRGIRLHLLAPILILLFGHIAISLVRGWQYYRDRTFTSQT